MVTGFIQAYRITAVNITPPKINTRVPLNITLRKKSADEECSFGYR